MKDRYSPRFVELFLRDADSRERILQEAELLLLAVEWTTELACRQKTGINVAFSADNLYFVFFLLSFSPSQSVKKSCAGSSRSPGTVFAFHFSAMRYYTSRTAHYIAAQLIVRTSDPRRLDKFNRTDTYSKYANREADGVFPV